MQFTNQNEFKANLQNTTTTTTTTPTEIITTTTNANTDTTGSCASSTDSGIIIIDNNTRTYSNNNKNNSSNNNNHNNSNNININNDNKNKTTNKNMRKDNIFDDNKENEKLKNDNSSECNTINIENIINISKNNDKKNIVDDVISDTKTTSITAAYANNDRWQNHEEKQSQQRQNDYYNKSNKNITTTCAAATTTTTNIKNCSPTTSIRSTTISIVSIDENAIDSSVVDSDSDFEADAEGVHSNYVVKKLGQQVTYPPNSKNLPHLNEGLRVISQKISPGGSGLTAAAGVGSLAENILNGGLVVPTTSNGTAIITPTAPQIGSIALSNSTDVTFGDKNYFGGPVTLQQIVIDSRNEAAKRKCDDCGNGHDNPMFAHDHGDVGGDLSGKNKSTQKEPSSKFISNRKTVIITSAIILLTIIIGIVIVTTSTIFKTSYGKSKILLGDGDDSRKNIPINSTIDNNDKNDNNAFNGTLQIVKRDDWSARESGKDYNKLNLPAHRVIISHTASDTCSSRQVCDYRLRVIQAFHMDSMQWADIGYNFLVGGDGLVYEGRGWDIQGAHTKGYNPDSIGISFIGTFTAVRPTEAQLNCTQLLLQEGVRLKKLVPDYRLYGHRQLGSTESPDRDNIGGGQILRIVARDGWLAQPPIQPLLANDLPVHRVIVIPTQTDICNTQAACTYRVRYIQTFNIESLQHDDIIYNFLIGGGGNVYEGRGWDFKGAHLRGYNDDSISLAYIGTFRQQKPSDKQMSVTKLLLDEGIRLGKLSPDYKIISAYKLDPTSTDTAGDALYESFEAWPHWS